MTNPSRPPGPDADWAAFLVDRFAPRGTGGDGCLDGNLIAGYLADGLTPSEHERVERHVAACGDCRAVLVAVGGDELASRTTLATATPGVPAAVPAHPRARPAPSRWPGAVKPLLAAGLAAGLLVGAYLAFRPPHPPALRAELARAERPRGASPADAFTVDVEPGGAGFVRLCCFSATGQRRDLPLRDGQLTTRIAARTRFGEFESSGCWRLLVAFAADRELLERSGLADLRLSGATVEERTNALELLAAELRRAGVAAVILAGP